jgi:hypothetical protein
VYRLHIETVLSLFFYNKTLLYLSIALWLFTEFLHIKEINKEKSDYKIMTKCIATRLKNNLIKSINKNQSGFIKGRYIGDKPMEMKVH